MRPITIVNSIFFIAIATVAIGVFGYNISWWWLLGVCSFFLSIHFIGVVHIQFNYFVKSYNKGEKGSKRIALSFDDGPVATTGDVLDILSRAKVPAAFFCIGKRAATNTEMLKRIDAEGHIVGNHSYEHGFMFDWQSSAKMAEDMNRANTTIAQVIGKEPLLFRPPYGITNPNVARAIKATGMKSIGWSLRSYDTTTDNADKLLQRVLSKLQDGDVILLHDSMNVTVEILTDLIAAAKKKGFTFVRIDDLFGIKAYA